ncbi:uncharacterized protein B0I36DRAFT_310692 [Microdochium trichocladiopsis]|uniref:Uncharacterized protein n=1 Tax=Microdochium trichocladiopsis TaxID=1682393 RepID=A0A9P8YES1_9PEZI|nr:uncharacterized protein B0I36DRAFT_310692 [Microdochium trichocladiopsis]KAH7040442.1 hypothetical protein B0I36DRAFT_310692 [Microdochium trichocladiopsis]
MFRGQAVHDPRLHHADISEFLTHQFVCGVVWRIEFSLWTGCCLKVSYIGKPTLILMAWVRELSHNPLSAPQVHDVQKLHEAENVDEVGGLMNATLCPLPQAGAPASRQVGGSTNRHFRNIDSTLEHLLEVSNDEIRTKSCWESRKCRVAGERGLRRKLEAL